jgi:peptidoglycan LD-endopeptidase LytH
VSRAVARAALLLLAAAACNGDGEALLDRAAPTSTSTSSTVATTTTSSVTTTTAAPTSTTAAPKLVPRYVFPVQGGWSYSQTHAAYPATDIFARCGTPVVAVTDGRVDELSRVDRWDPANDNPALRSGLFVSLVGDDGVRYYGSHFSEVAAGLSAGSRVGAGDLLGRIGQTGNARGRPCHVHFGISPPTGPGDWEVRRGVVWPWRYLDSWKAGGQLSPREEVLNTG